MFTVKCCSTARFLLNGVLICPKCDYAGQSTIPFQDRMQRVPEGVKQWPTTT